MSAIQQGQKLIVIRYGKKQDCIEKHCEVINKLGYCWFGKIGIVPSKKAIDAVMKENNPKIILYSQGKGYVADCNKIIFEKPETGYPDYYEEELFAKLVFPKSYYKISSIKQLSSEELSQIRVVSSGSPIIETLNKSMSSFFFVEFGRTPIKETKTSNHKKSKKAKLSIDECLYNIGGICNRKGFVSYKYKCERPSTCSGQKR